LPDGLRERTFLGQLDLGEKIDPDFEAGEHVNGVTNGETEEIEERPEPKPATKKKVKWKLDEEQDEEEDEEDEDGSALLLNPDGD
jgi:hypothetical protein